MINKETRKNRRQFDHVHVISVKIRVTFLSP